MNLAVKNSTIREHTIIWAIICSVLFHGLLVVVIPNIKLNTIKKPDILEIELVKKPAPPPAILLEPIQPQPQPEAVKPKIEPKPELKPLVKPLPMTKLVKSEATPYQPPTTTAPQTEVIAVPAKPDAAPSPTPPAPIVAPTPPPQPVGPSQTDIEDARGKYGNALWGAIGKHKHYPKIAQMRGWQGDVTVELQLDGNGKLKSKKIIQSSSYDVLDKQALDMVEKAAPFPAPPEALRDSNFGIKVQIPFKLEEQ